MIFSFQNLLKQSIRFLSRRLNTQPLRDKYDIIIAGGGIIGYGFAAVAVESTLPKTFELKEEYDNRVIALNQSSQNVLESIGAWNFIKSNRLQPVKKMLIWETESCSQLLFEKDLLACIVENNLIIESLSKYLKNYQNSSPNGQIEVVHGSRVKNIQFPTEKCPSQLVRLDIQENSTQNVQMVETNLLVGADGLGSVVRKAAGLDTVGWNHDQKAIVATLQIDGVDENFTAWQQFTSTGPIAILPVSEFGIKVWITSTLQCDRLMSLNPSEFVDELNDTIKYSSSEQARPFTSLSQTFACFINKITNNTPCTSDNFTMPSLPRVRSIQENTTRACFPLGFQHATHYCGPRTVLIGDAAHRILPLAGQGANLGFGDIVCLVKHIENAISHGADVGNATYLEDYTTERQRIVVPIAAAMELLNALYSTDVIWKRFLSPHLDTDQCEYSKIQHLIKSVLMNIRSAGMDTVHSSSSIKEFLINTAMTGQIGYISSYRDKL